ncbi:ligand-binding sensor domain-containing protein [Prevotella sp. khp7]|uniref:triple tyrosine motif-containing protein n=1 Tax=Prevotella sp. khp7 TaxID=1761885 RepID=UPI0008B56799|nr:triple tyrosine motif-containing protein [Prevotella sp. khp7]SEW03337.1 ligand-binding sensor domain-containing protein [Prevotella sp. khp7]
MKKWILLLLVATTLQVTAQNPWQRAVINYSRQTYHSGNQNWQIGQSKEGWMYFANNSGLLEYDGTNWSTYPLPGNTKVRSVLPGSDTIYVGALGQFGRFVRNNKGKMAYQELSGKMGQKGQVNIWYIHRIGNDVFFQSDNAFYINDYKTRLACEPGVHYSTVVYNRLYITSYKGLSVLVGKKFVPLEGIDIRKTSNIVAILPWQQKLLLVTSNNGLYLYSNNRLQPFNVADNKLSGGIQLSCAALSGSMLALGTLQDGVILMDLRTNTIDRISTNNGLQNKTVLSTAFDNDQNLWLALDNGLDCIQLSSPMRFLNSRQSPIGSGNCSITYQGKLYFGTNQGLYVMEGNHIRFVEGTGSQVLCLDTIGGQLFCGGRQFFMNINGSRITHYDNRGVWGVRALSRHPDVLLTSSYWGLRLMKQLSQGWKIAEKVKGADISAKTFYIEELTDAIWVANKEKGLYRLTLSNDLLNVKSKKCYNSAALPKGDNVYITKIDGEMVIASRQGLFRYDATHDQLVRHFALEQQLGGQTAYTYIYQSSDGCIWYATDGAMHVSKDHVHHSYLNDCLMEDFENVSFTNHHQAVIGTEDGFALLENQQSQDTARLIQPYIRRIVIGNNTDTLYYKAETPQIKWGNNSLRFEYSANSYDPTQTIRFSYWLEGSEEQEWSQPTRLHIKEYTNLPEGHYTYHVRVITANGSKSGETCFEFTILPPWYRTWWAYTLYIITILIAICTLYRRLVQSRQRLIQEKDEQIENLEEEKLEIELRARQDELVRSRMNIVRKNEMLQEIKKTAVSINNGLSEENLPAIKRRVVRLIGQIDTNIEHDEDLEAFRSEFDSVHHNFLKTLGERYPQLSHKEKMLCAYIRMNLMSKEIAPLLNISIRGVEIARYRIRQKFALSQKDSLTDFLQAL